MRKKTTIVLSIFIFLCTWLSVRCCVSAAPLINYPCSIMQPDGTEIECYLNGDEYFGYLTDSNGTIIVRNTTTGEYTYAEFTQGELRATANVVGKTYRTIQVEGVTISDISEEYIKNRIQNKKLLRRENSDMDMFDLSENKTSTMEFKGKTLNNIVIFVEFSNKVFSSSHKSYDYYEGLFNANNDSVKNFYSEVSYGQASINSVLATPNKNGTIVVYKSSNPRSYYESDYDLLHELMDEAIIWATSNEYIPNDLNYDADGDGNIDCVTFIFAGDVQNHGEYVFWPQAWWDGYVSETIYGKNVYNYCLIPEKLLYNTSTGNLFQRNAAILCHESFHAVFEGGDLYDDSLGKSWNSNYQVYANATPVRNWDIMSSSPGAHMSSYMKYRYGNWIEIPEITSSGTYTLKPLKTSDNTTPNGTTNNTVAYLLRSPIAVSEPNDVSQYFIVEYRKYDGVFETQSYLQDEGLVVYRINSNFDDCGNNYNEADDNSSKYEIEEIYPKSSSLVLKYSNNISSGIIISDVIENSDGTLSFEVTMPTTRNLFYFKDSRLAEAVRSAIGKTSSEITTADITNLTTLSVSINSAELPLDLTGMEYLTGLTSFTAKNCKIEDISPLQDLNNLEYLDLANNNIKDISALNNLDKLDTLKLRGNLIDDYMPTQSYYNDIAIKDFSLNDVDDFVFRIKNVSESGEIGTVYIIKGQYVPQKVYRTIELYNSDGILQKKTKNSMSISSENTEMTFTMPDGYVCDANGSYVVLSLYEREDERQILTKIIIKPSFFDLNSFN